MTPRAHGWLKDAHSPHDQPLDLLLAGARRPKSSLPTPDLRHVRGPALFQLNVNSCVAFSLSRAVYMSLRLQGHADPPIPAPLLTYFAARRREHLELSAEAAPPVKDVGCYPRLAIEAMRAVGFLPWSAWSYDPAQRNTPPSPYALSGAYSQQGLAYYRVTQTGRAKVNAVADALRHRYPITFGMPIDNAFFDFVGGDAAPMSKLDTNDIVGGHAMSVLAVDEKRDLVLVDNWWGEDWGGNGDGTGWMKADLWAAYADDVYAIVAAPIYAADGALL